MLEIIVIEITNNIIKITPIVILTPLTIVIKVVIVLSLLVIFFIIESCSVDSSILRSTSSALPAVAILAPILLISLWISSDFSSSVKVIT